MCGKKARSVFIGAVLALFAFVGSLRTARGATTTVVTITDGRLRGLRRNGVREFLGIPYATPPWEICAGGRLRWSTRLGRRFSQQPGWGRLVHNFFLVRGPFRLLRIASSSTSGHPIRPAPVCQ